MERIFRFIDRVEKFTLVWTILVLAAIGFIQVITRYVFNYSFTWYEELGRYLGVFIAFLGGAIGVKSDSHFTMDLVVNSLKPPRQQILRALTSAMSAIFFAIIICYSYKIISRMHGYGTTSPTMQIPMYIAYLPILIFSVMICFRFFLKSIFYIKEIFSMEYNYDPGSIPTDLPDNNNSGKKASDNDYSGNSDAKNSKEYSTSGKGIERGEKI